MRRPMLAASTDAIRSVAKGLVSAKDNPRLFKAARGAFGSDKNVDNMSNNPQKVLAYEIAEAEETWKSVLDFVSYGRLDSRDFAIEGVAVLPHLLNNLDFDCCAVFMVNLDDQTDRLIAQSRTTDDWLNKYDDNIIRTYGKFSCVLNNYYYTEARKFGFPTVVVKSGDIDTAAEKAVDILLG